MPDPVEHLIEKLKSSDRDVVKSSVIEDLGRSGDHRAIKPLISTLNDSDMLVRWNAIQALAKFGADSLPALMKALESDDKFARRNVVQALGEVGGEETVDKLIKMLMFDESDSTVLIEIIRALQKLKPERAVGPLITILKMNDWEMKWRAIHTLGQIGDTAAMEPLLVVMNDEDPDIRWAASVAIENIKKKTLSGADAGSSKASSPLVAPPPVPSVPAELNMTTNVKGAEITVCISGDINYTNAANFRSYVEGVSSASAGTIILDLSDCHFVDSFGLSQFNTIRKKLKTKNRVLKITGMDPNLRLTFEATKLDELFVIGD